MATATVNGLTLGYETIGEGPPWVITPGGRYLDPDAAAESAEAVAQQGR